MTSGLVRFGRPTPLTCNLGTSGVLGNHQPAAAYNGGFTVINRVGTVTAELVSATPALPAGWSLAVNQATGVVTLAWPEASATGSPPFSLLHFDGADGSTAFPDDSGLAWTRLGSAVISTTQSRFGGASGQFAPGWGVRSAGTLSAPTGLPSNDLGNWTCEFWLFLPANITTYQPILHITALDSISSGALSLRISGGGAGTNELYFSTSAASGGPIGYVVPTGQWVHIAIVRQRDLTYLYANGALRWTTGPAAGFANEHIWIGRCDPVFGASEGFSGFIDEFRFVLGSALYTGSTYTVPTAPFILPTGTSALPNLGFESGGASWLLGNAWVIDSTALVETGTQSAKYNGPGQSTLSHAQAVPVTPGTTITASARISKGTNRADFAGGAVVLQWLDADGVPISFAVGNVVNTGSSAFQTSSVTATAPAGAALVRLAVSGSRDVKGRARDRVYVDNLAWNHSYAIGAGANTDYAVVIRVRDGRGCQATFSQTIMQGLPSTLALLNYEGSNGSTSIVDETGRAWTARGAAQITTTNPQFGTGAALFDASSAWIDTPSSPDFAFGTGDFCFETFFRPNSLAGTGGPIVSYTLFAHGNWSFYFTERRELFVFDGVANILGLPSELVVPNAYNHAAWSRQGSTMRLYLNGDLIQTTSNSTSFSAAAVSIGRYTAGNPSFGVGRYDSSRISRTARYTNATYTVPPAPFVLD